MKYVRLFHFFAISSVIYLSCNKQIKEEATPEPEVYKSSIKPCDCLSSKSDDYRIELTFNGMHLCFDRNQMPVQPALWEIGQNPFDRIGMGRLNKDSTLMIGIGYQSPQFFKHTLPYSIDSTNVWNCEVVSVTILNFKPYKFCEGCPTNDFQYGDLSSVGDLTAQIISFRDSILEGTFEGNFHNGGGAKFPVTDGYFKIKLVSRKMDF